VVDRDRSATPPYDGPLNTSATVAALECVGKTPYERAEHGYDDGLAKVQASAEEALDDLRSSVTSGGNSARGAVLGPIRCHGLRADQLAHGRGGARGSPFARWPEFDLVLEGGRRRILPIGAVSQFDNAREVHQGSTGWASPVSVSHLQSR
jgi:hypothetical protein